MSNNKNAGFSIILALLVLVILVVIGLGGWYVWQSRTNNAEHAVSTTKKETPTSIPLAGSMPPAGWLSFKDTTTQIMFAYPPAWRKDAFTVEKDTAFSVGDGCGVAQCLVTYDTWTNTWSSPNDGIFKPLATRQGLQAFLVPKVGELNCGDYIAFVHYPGYVVDTSLFICTPPKTSYEITPPKGALLYDDVVKDLKLVLATFYST